ncbi:7684_t:CDS:2 [Dentiscutata erythropus]|uniref:7684_t:CDS:1 n=1 Tax=Dentiscutata erythropus TaxID=1348616 RepID=A0A9N8Z2C1_9GLOM|nr:7684_t:CDS:2 [Dentiscutata erythropus]
MHMYDGTKNDLDADSITISIEALTINCVKQENINDNKISKIKLDIKELIKVVKDLLAAHIFQTIPKLKFYKTSKEC